MKSTVLVFILGFVLAGCSHMGKKHATDKGSPELEDAVLGTWIQKDIQCAAGDFTSEGSELASAFRIGMSAAKVVVTSDKSFWDMKEYRDVENPNDFCQISAEEKWTTPAPGQLSIADSDTIVSGNGQVDCERKFRRKGPRDYTYQVSEKDLTIHLNSPNGFMVADQEKKNPICKKSEVILQFQRDPSDE